MRLLLINPNTTESVTERVAARAREVVGDGAEIRAVTARFGARYIASRTAYAVAGHAALEALSEHGEGCDAVLLACFGDPGLAALKELSPVPVVGMAEASCHLACLLGRRFSIVTGGTRWKPMLEEFVAALGLSGRLAGVRSVAPTGGEIARDPDGAVQLLADEARRCAGADGADVVILGGAGLVGLAARVAPLVPVPVFCSVEAGLRAVLAVVGIATARPSGEAVTSSPAESTGLGIAPAGRPRQG